MMRKYPRNQRLAFAKYAYNWSNNWSSTVVLPRRADSFSWEMSSCEQLAKHDKRLVHLADAGHLVRRRTTCGRQLAHSNRLANLRRRFQIIRRPQMRRPRFGGQPKNRRENSKESSKQPSKGSKDAVNHLRSLASKLAGCFRILFHARESKREFCSVKGQCSVSSQMT